MMKWICQFETADGIIGQEFYNFDTFPDHAIKRIVRTEINAIRVDKPFHKIEQFKTRLYELKNVEQSKFQAYYKEKL